MKILSKIFKAIQRFFYPSVDELPDSCKPVVEKAKTPPFQETDNPLIKKTEPAPLPPIPPVNPPKKASKRIDITSDAPKPKRKRYHNRKKGNPDIL